MSASIHWRPERKEQQIDVAAPSSFVEAMNKAFGTYPWKLTPASCDKLWGMAALSCDGAKRNPYEAIIEVIDEWGTIELWPEY